MLVAFAKCRGVRTTGELTISFHASQSAAQGCENYRTIAFLLVGSREGADGGGLGSRVGNLWLLGFQNI